MPTGSTLTYLVHGVARRDDPATSIDLCEEIQEVLAHPGPVAVSPTADGIEVRITVLDIEPFTRDNFEAYVYEQVLWHAVNACCDMDGAEFRFELKAAEFTEMHPRAQ
jgi:hypothetical protein